MSIASPETATEQPHTERGAQPLNVSVIVPVRNEAASLPALIASLRQQTFSPTEIVIVDGGSTDETAALARQLTADDARFRVIEAGAATPGRGRNVGSAAARCAWLAYTDAGIRVEPTWLARLTHEVVRDGTVEVVYGNFEPVTRTRFERAAALTYPPPKQMRPGGLMRGPSIASSLMRRAVWQRVGGFPDLRAAEDLLFMKRIVQAGCKIAWAAQATVWWQLQPTFGSTFRKFLNYSRHNVWAGQQRYWHYGLARQYLIAALFVGLALWHTRWWLLVLPLGLLARVAKSIWQRREGRGWWWACTPVQFGYVLLITLTIDAATFIGWMQAAWRTPAPNSTARTDAGQTES